MPPNIVIRWQRHPLIDAFVYTTFNKLATYDTVRFHLWLFLQRPRNVSNIQPILIGGCPRSGTTLARALIGMHPSIISPKQEYNLLMWANKKETLSSILELNSDDVQQILNQRKDIVKQAELAVHFFKEKHKKSNVALKHPLHIAILKYLFNYFPNIRFIHIIRDGRDTVSSLRTYPKRQTINGRLIPTNIKNPFKWCVRQWVSYVSQGRQWQNHHNYIEIFYEDLVEKTIPTMETVFRFLELEMIESKQLLRFYENEQNNKHIQNIEVGKPIYHKTIGRWEHDFSEQDKKVFKKMAGDLLLNLGYVNNNNW